MRRIRVIEILEATTGGTRRHLNDLVTHVDSRRFALSVICSLRRDARFEEDIRCMRERGVPVALLNMVRPVHPFLDLFAFARLRACLRRMPCDVLHVHSSKAGILGRLAAQPFVPRERVIYTPHVFPFQMALPAWRRRLYEAIERKAAPRTHRIVCVSREELRRAEQAGLRPRGGLSLIPNGIQAPGEEPGPSRVRELRQQLGFPDEATVVGMIGRYTQQKGHAVLLRALRRLAPAEPGVRALLMVDPGARDRVRRAVHDAGLSAVCRISPAELAPEDVHAASDIMVLPSLWEGLPYVLLDAMASARAVAASAVGGMVDAVRDGHNGRLFPVNDDRALADVLAGLSWNAELRRTLGREARATICHDYRLSDMIRRTESLYEECMRRPNPEESGGRQES